MGHISGLHSRVTLDRGGLFRCWAAIGWHNRVADVDGTCLRERAAAGRFQRLESSLLRRRAC
jgi:hypothetical protein